VPNPSAFAFEGHAIVSVDGMIADAEGRMPPALHNDADWRLFQAALDEAKLVVLGSVGHMLHPNPGRRRLVLTRSVDDLSADPRDPLARFWNPAGLPMEAALETLGITGGTIAITGGRGIFDYFAPSFTAFSLVEVPGLVLRGGTSCFSAGHPRVVLAAWGLRPAMPEVIDPATGVTLTRWAR
jgi:hypothetical protein